MPALRRSMEDYKGLHIGCAPCTHAGLVEMLLRHTRPSNGVLDLGAHAGALLERLRDHGFDALMGADLDETRFAIKDAGFCKLEVNGPFSGEIAQSFSLITATDVIEHLDNPRAFLTELRKMLTDDGWIALSFPNVGFWEGRLKFLLKGELWGFGRRNYVDQRHISPMTPEQTDLMLRELGFEPAEIGTAGSFATPLRKLLFAPLWLPLRWIGGPFTMGESVILVAQKASRQADLKTPTHYKDRWQGVPDQIGLTG